MLMPLEVVRAPASPEYELMADAVAANLDYEMLRQTESGAWVPTWDWSKTDADAWAKAKEEWSGVLTLDMLLTLRAFGRIEGM